MKIPQELTEAAFNRLHHAINERRNGTQFIKVAVEDLKALLYAYQELFK